MKTLLSILACASLELTMFGIMQDWNHMALFVMLLVGYVLAMATGIVIGMG